MWKSYKKSAKDTYLSRWKNVQSGLFVCLCVRAQVFHCFCYYYPHVSPAASVCSTKLCQHVITFIVNVIKAVMNVIISVMNVISLVMNMIGPVMTANNFITHLVACGYCK